MRCPKCSSEEVRRSRRASLIEYIGSLFFAYPYRCRRCTHRFFSTEEKVQKLLYAHCPKCGNFELEKISSRHVPVRWFKGVARTIRRRAYRCDLCRWRFFDLRRLAPKATQRARAADTS